MTKAKTAKAKRTAKVDEHDEVAKAPRDFYAALTDWRSRSGPIEPDASEVFANVRRDRLLGTPLAVRLANATENSFLKAFAAVLDRYAPALAEIVVRDRGEYASPPKVAEDGRLERAIRSDLASVLVYEDELEITPATRSPEPHPKFSPIPGLRMTSLEALQQERGARGTATAASPTRKQAADRGAKTRRARSKGPRR